MFSAIPLGQTRKISIITKDTGKPDSPCKVTVISPKGQTLELPTSQSPDGYEANFTPKEPGQYTVKVEFASKEVPKSPFTVTVETTETKAPKPGKPMEQQRKFNFIYNSKVKSDRFTAQIIMNLIYCFQTEDHFLMFFTT